LLELRKNRFSRRGALRKENQELVLRVKGENYHLRLDEGHIYDGIVRRSTPEHPFRKFMENQGARTLGIELGPQGVDYIRFNTGGDYYLTEIRQFGSVQWISMHKAFADCGALTFAEYCDTPDLSLVSDMSAMFLNCRNSSQIFQSGRSGQSQI